ncbi:MAG: hypothetical protein DHS20C14_01690 [Phycisphaeraceae bacterium]|nr:MAG: hypothetical protein DHS20C14_01690 [Phycisphaeraceae bacterium]
MRPIHTALCAGLLIAPAAMADVTVGVDQSDAPWLAFMNVFELDGTTYAFGSGWGIADLNASFDDGAGTLEVSPNTIGDPDPYWYIGGGGPGQAGNKIMEANLYQEVTDAFAGQTVTFEGTVLSDTFTSAHTAYVFIKDFAADYSSFTETKVAVSGTGAFSISHVTSGDAGRHVQWGIQTVGVNVWTTDTAPFGSTVFGTVPTPATAAILGLGGLMATRRRR